MDHQSINYKHKIDFLISNDTSLIQQTQTIIKKRKYKKCNGCNKTRKILESHQICHVCYKTKTVYKQELSGNKVIDDFVKHTQINYAKHNGKMEFVPHDQFKNIEFIAEGGFSKIYKATWIDGPVISYKNNIRDRNRTVVLKKLNNSKNITSKELNELKVFYDFSSKWKGPYWDGHVSKYYGMTQDAVTKDMMIIMPHYSGDLIQYITKDFYNIWYTKLGSLKYIINGLKNIHSVDIVHRDFHSGNIFFDNNSYIKNMRIGDLGISKSATDSTDDDSNENYGIIPYMAPEIFLGQRYTKNSDIYSFGMIMWELMTGRRPFWDRNHDADLILEIIDDVRPPIITNAPEGYIKLMEKCWHADPNKRPTATDVCEKITKMWNDERNNNPTKIIESPDIGPITKINPGAIYKSRPLSGMINSALSLRSSRNQTIDKRKFIDNLIGDNNDDRSIKRKKSLENENIDRLIKEITETEFNNEYITRENDFDV